MHKIVDFDPYKALKSIVEITSTHAGKDFLRVTAKEIKKLFQSDLVFIALEKKPTSVKIIYSTDESTPRKIELKESPCELIYKECKIININKDLKKRFKKLKNNDYESFYGIPIMSKNKCIGHISIFFKYMKDMPIELEDIANIYAKKIERELKRIKLENENETIRKELEKLAITDSLTSLNNRRFFSIIGEDVFAQVKRDSITATLAYIDIDDFKAINDKFGHDGGDQVLLEFSLILQKESRKGVDHLFRLGGEEFCIISINTKLESCFEHLARVMNSTSAHFKNTKYGEITLSIGIVDFDKKFNDYHEIVSLADKKMYRAKKAGKNTIVK